MDVPTGAGADPDPFLVPWANAPAAEVERRLEAVENGLARVNERLEALADSLETTVHAAVASEVHAAADGLRHAVSELGRILVRDVGKLPQMLAQHRQAIVDDLLGAAGTEPRATAGATDSVDSGGATAIEGPTATGEVAGASDDPAAPPSEGDHDGDGDRGWRDHLRRRRT